MSKFAAVCTVLTLGFFLPLRAAQDFSPAYNFSVFAGSAAEGSADGSATTARFNNPSDTAVDSAGNVYVADRGNHTIRKITPAGVVSTLAGKAGEPGNANGGVGTARLNFPDGLAVDASGNVFVSDFYNVRKISPAGTLTGIAVVTARGLAVDRNGNLYAARTDYPVVYKFDPSEAQTLVAGPVESAVNYYRDFTVINDVAVDAAGNVYVSDSLNHVIRKVAATGGVTTFAGQTVVSGVANDAAGTSAVFDYPVNLAIDGVGNLFVTDIGNRTVRRITPAGVVTSLAGNTFGPNPGIGAGKDAYLVNPQGISSDASGTIYFIDGNIIYKGIPASAASGGGNPPTTPAGSSGGGSPGGSSSGGGGGGGGAPSLWFLGALAVLGCRRWLDRHRA